MNQPIKNNPVWDKANSTYMRLIVLANGVTLTGYSKKVARNERNDKTDLLTNWILRDYKNGYLNRRTKNEKITQLEYIDYFKQTDSEYEPIIKLTYTHPEWLNPQWMENRKLYVFINRFYDFIHKGKDESFIINALEVRSRTALQDPFNLTFNRFSTIRDLNAYIDKLTNQKDLSREAIQHFYRSYMEKYFNNPSNNL
jgi:hypothetical protein